MRKHRGLAPEDNVFFDANRLERLREAVCDLSWLLTRSYKASAAVSLVGNHFQLNARERLAIVHAASDGTVRHPPETFAALEGKKVCVDGFNVLITLETALGGGIVLRGMDGCYRDIADIQGSYSLRFETEQAVELAVTALKKANVKEVLWLFDRPVSNSGRLAGLVRKTAQNIGIPVQAKTADQVDGKIKQCDGIAVTADSDILAGAPAWFDLAGWIIEHNVPTATVIDLRC
jgi:hypothetical protein